jgi:cell wall-associated NlpC family hydrolase
VRRRRSMKRVALCVVATAVALTLPLVAFGPGLHMAHGAPLAQYYPGDAEYPQVAITDIIDSSGNGTSVAQVSFKNTDTYWQTFDTWWWGTSATLQSNVHAWDAQGPISVETEAIGYQLYIYVLFRQSLAPGDTYTYWLSTDIQGLGWWNGTAWSRAFCLCAGWPVGEYVVKLNLPCDGVVSSASAAPVTQRPGYVEWVFYSLSSSQCGCTSASYVTKSPNNGLDLCALQNGDILIGHRDGLDPPTLAMVFAGSYWAHAGVYAGEGQVVEAVMPVVTKRSITETSFWNTSDWAILRVGTDQAKRGAAVAYTEQQIGKPYLIQLDKYLESAFYCTQLVWRAYEKQGIDLDSNRGLLSSTCPGLWPFVLGDDLVLSPYVQVVSERMKSVEEQLKRSRSLLWILSPADFYITDPQGRHVGVNPATGEVVNEMPELAWYSGPDVDPEVVAVSDLDGTWSVEVIGTGTGEYTFGREAVDPTLPRGAIVEGATTEGEIDEYETEYPPLYPAYVPLMLRDR